MAGRFRCDGSETRLPYLFLLYLDSPVTTLTWPDTKIPLPRTRLKMTALAVSHEAEKPGSTCYRHPPCEAPDHAAFA